MSATTVLSGARVVLPDTVHDPGDVTVTDDVITRVVASRTRRSTHAHRGGPPTDAPLAADTVDLSGCWLVPGFVDMHVHGGGGASYTSGDPHEALRAVEFHRAHGTTTTVASLVTGMRDQLLCAVSALAELVDDGVLAGLHLEGPYLSQARCGAHDPRILRAPDPSEVNALVKAGRGAVRMMTLAPELPGAVDLVRRLTGAGVVAAIGHTDATHREAQDALVAGAGVATHLFNAMRGLHHREPGPITALLDDSDAVVELVNDGVHVHPAVVNLTYRAAGSTRVAFVTDAMGAAGMPDGTYPLGSMTVRVENGVARLADDGDVIAGSTLTLDRALRAAVQDNRVPITDAVRSVSTTPARALGLSARIGTIEAGKQADMVVLSSDLHVRAVLRRGRWVRPLPDMPKPA